MSSSHHMPASASPRQKWTLTQEAFDRLLASLGTDRDSAGEKYLEIRRNLIRFFEWRGCAFPEDHADETINRVAKRIASGEQVRDPASYSLGVARLLLLEIIKGRAREQVALKEIRSSPEKPSSVLRGWKKWLGKFNYLCHHSACVRENGQCQHRLNCSH